jgi:hypothetical protein
MTASRSGRRDRGSPPSGRPDVPPERRGQACHRGGTASRRRPRLRVPAWFARSPPPDEAGSTSR